MEQLRRNTIAWLERTNPLRGLSISRAGSIFDSARVWGSPRLQYMYNEIEATDPVLMTCVERRAAAIAGLQRQFVAISGADEVLANEQRDALSRFAAQIDNFDDALERMDEAFFRGYCHMQPIWDGDTVPHVNFLNSWNFMRDDTGRWLWNPLCHETIHGLGDVKGARLVSLVRRRAIDYPAIFIYIRKALGERDYGRFMERHGIPHAAIIMAPGTTKDDVPQYLASAGAWSNGQDMVIPNGAGLELATEARGADPFTPFVEHQDKYIVLLATGGTLTSLAQADTGSLAGGAQMDVWREIVTRDGALIADAMNRGLFRRYLERAFPGRPVAAEFRLSNEKKPSASEVADLAGKLKAAGWSIDQDELQEAVGYTLVKDEIEKVGGESRWTMDGRLPFMNKAPADPSSARPLADESTNKDFPTHAGQSEAAGQQSQGQDHGKSSEDVLAAFAKDTGPAADAIAKLLQDPSPEAAKALMTDLDKLLPDDPALAAVIAEAMAGTFAVDAASSPRQENKDDANGVSHSDADGKFDGGNDGSSGGKTEKSEDKPKSADDDLKNRTPAQHMEHGKAAIREALASKADVKNAMYRNSTGPIDFIWGKEGTAAKKFKDGEGIAHINKKHNKDLYKLPGVIAHGAVYQHPDKANRVAVVKGRMLVILEKKGQGSYLITGFEPDVPSKYLARYRAQEMLEGEL